MTVPAWIEWPPVVAAYDRARHAVIGASAGTGKTFTLEHLVLRELVEGTPVEQILVVTFTEKATDELRRRVRATVELVLDRTEVPPFGAHVLSPEERASLARARDAFERAAVSTIHGFCQRTLDEHAFEGGRFLREERVDDATLGAAAFHTLVTQEAARDAALGAWIDLFLAEGDGIEALRGALARVAPLPAERLTPRFDPVGLAAALRALPVAAARAELAADPVAVLALDLIACGDVPSVVRERGALEVLVAEKTRRAGPAARALADALAPLLAEVPSLPVAVLCALLPRYRAALRARKAELGVRDYDDLLHSLRDALHDGARGERLVQAVRAKYRVALIDEFQDTDEVQWDIFRTLFTGAEGRRLVVIGDPKQAIYGFRNADVETYLRAVGELTALGAQRIELDRCYRSTAALVDAYSALLEDDVMEEAPPPVRAGPRPPRFVDPHLTAPIVRLDLPALPAGLSREAHGAWMATEIRRLLREATFEDRALRADDILILTHSAQEGITLGRALRDRGVRVAYYKQDGLFQTAEAYALYDALAAVAAPNDLSVVLRACLTPFFELPLSSLRGMELGRGHPALQRIGAWAALAERRQYAQLFSAMFDDSGVLRRAAFLGGRERAVTNYLHLAELAIEWIAQDPPLIGDVVAWLGRAIAGHESARRGERDVQRLESDGGAVQIMTVHKAKGLEAPVVFLYGGLYRGPGGPPLAYRRDGERWYDLRRAPELAPELRALVDAEEARENGRLAYVAMTRAKARVYVHSGEANKRKPSGRHARLSARVATWMAAEGARAAVAVPLALRELVGGAADAGADGWTPAPDPLPEVGYEALLRAAAPLEVTSYSRLKSESEHHLDPDAAERLGEHGEAAPLELKPGELPGGRETGVFVHQLLERVPLASVAGRPGLDAWRARPDVRREVEAGLLEHRIAAEHRAHAEALVHAALTATLPLDPPLPGLAEADQVVREMDFLFPWPGRRFVKGFLDVVLAHRGRTWVVDWKSDRLRSYDSAALAEQVAQRYQTQVELYALALARIVGVTDEEGHRARFGGVVYVFLRGLSERGAVHVARPSWAELADWARRLPGEALGEVERSGQATLFPAPPAAPATAKKKRRRP